MAPRRTRSRKKSSSSSEEKPRRIRGKQRKRKQASSTSESDGNTSEDSNTVPVERKCDHIMSALPTSHEEKMLYKEMFEDIDDVPKEKIYCTACRKSLTKAVASKNTDNFFQHPVLGLLLCKKCFEFYGEGFLEDDGDGNDAYCRLCAQGGELFCCSQCNCAFCKGCVKNNFERSVVKVIEESDDWLCFACEPKQLLFLRAVCCTIFESLNREKKYSIDARMKALCEKKNEPSPRSRRLRARVANGKHSSGESDSASGSSDKTSEDSVPEWLKECLLDAIHISKILYKTARKISMKHNPLKGQDGVAKTVRHLTKLAGLMTENGDKLVKTVELNFIADQVEKEDVEEIKISDSEQVTHNNASTSRDDDDIIVVNGNEDRITSDVCKEVKNASGESIITNKGTNLSSEQNGVLLSDEDLDSVSTVIVKRDDKKDLVTNKKEGEKAAKTNDIVTVEPDIFDLYDDEPLATPCAPSPVPSIISEDGDVLEQSTGVAENGEVNSKNDADKVDGTSLLDTSVSLDAPTEIIIDGAFSRVAKIDDLSVKSSSLPDSSILDEIQTAKRDVLAISSSDESQNETDARLRKRKSVDYRINEAESDDERKISRSKRNQKTDKQAVKSKTIIIKDVKLNDSNEMFDMSCNEEEQDIEEMDVGGDNDTEKESDSVKTEKEDTEKSVKTNVKVEKTDSKELEIKKPVQKECSNSGENISDNCEKLTDTENKGETKRKVTKTTHKVAEEGKKAKESDLSSSSGLDNSDLEVTESKPRKKRKKRSISKVSSDSVGAKGQQDEMKEDVTVKEDKSIDSEIKRLSNLRSFRLKKPAKSDECSDDKDDEDASDEEENRNEEKPTVKEDEEVAEQKEKKTKKKKGGDINTEKKSLLEYLNILSSNEDGDASSESEDHIENVKDSLKKKALAARQSIATRNELAKKLLFKSSGSEPDNSDDSLLEKIDKEIAPKKRKEPKKKDVGENNSKGNTKKEDSAAALSTSESEDEESKAAKAVKAKWKRSKLLTGKLSETDSEEEGKKFLKRKLKEEEEKSKAVKDNSDSDFEILDKDKKKSSSKKSRKQVIDSDSDVCLVSSSSVDLSSTDESDWRKKKSKKRGRRNNSSSSSNSSSNSDKKKKKRKRIKVMSDDESDDKADNSQKTETPGKGRKNIRKLLDNEELGKRTKAAAKEEEERKKRIAERQKMYNQAFEMVNAGVEKLEKLVLDFDPETKEELVVVDPKIVEKLKPHQAKGIKFMWEACFESLEQIKKDHASGCILAHCMGLGKTLQVVALVHTLLSNEETGVTSVLVVCPLNTVLNWAREFKIWLKDVHNKDDIDVYEMTAEKQNYARAYKLSHWKRTGGIMILGYEMYRILCNTKKRMSKKHLQHIQEALVDPGPDLIVCDEGHLLKNAKSALSKALSQIKTLRRIVLTGTPLQNNLKEYHCMIDFVKPDLLGTMKEFHNRFLNPIMNGQHSDSTPLDVRIMKRRAHVLHKMLDGCVQRFDYNVLTPFLPPKHEFVVSIRLSPIQCTLYKHFLENFARNRNRVQAGGKLQGASLFSDFHSLHRVWTHPYVLKLSAEQEDFKRMMADDSDSAGSLKDFIDDDDSDSSDSVSKSSGGSNSGSDGDVVCLEDGDKSKEKKKKKKDKDNAKEDNDRDEVINKWKSSTRGQGSGGNSDGEIADIGLVERSSSHWWSEFVTADDLENINHSGKLFLLFTILKECELIGDKVLVFSHSLFSLNVIEYFLNKVDEATQNITQNSETATTVGSFLGSWAKGLDYFRIDGSTSSDARNHHCNAFNSEDNHRARLFLISTKAGGLGINLVGANRVVIFDASWNPSHDVQSIFRIYRFGQKKPCYIYRFLAEGTMEEKIYDRQVTKLSLACRVVDEQQIERHFNAADLFALYEFDPKPKEVGTTPVLPKDRLLADLLHECGDWIFKYFEHDSLLENVEEEELTEEERKMAWEEYESEKKGINKTPFGQNTFGISGENFMQNMMQQYQQGPVINMPNLLAMIRRENPTLGEEALLQRYREAVLQVRSYISRQQNAAAALGHTNNPLQIPNPQFKNSLQIPNPQLQTRILEQSLRNLQVQKQYANQIRLQQQGVTMMNSSISNPGRKVQVNSGRAVTISKRPSGIYSVPQPPVHNVPESPESPSKDSDEVMILP